ncbi:hypothetical protein CHS0354_002247 [Potamilus streckersoni]|uniref:Uncharacterized protein n=1 Tax=Potamilus streckersoni TaxID=2493646 RepID=A0AAE0TCC4_9BIVA|nr:hypothetical protein CHS0354_002247 [Potamilus streckersoni]
MTKIFQDITTANQVRVVWSNNNINARRLISNGNVAGAYNSPTLAIQTVYFDAVASLNLLSFTQQTRMTKIDVSKISLDRLEFCMLLLE